MNQPTSANANISASPAARHAVRLVALLAALLVATPAMAARVKDLAAIKGVRDNQLVGYGIVVGLNGTGDSKNAAFTTNSLANLMRNMGVKIDPQDIKVKNVASVIVTAKLPAFVKVGQAIDVTLSSVGDASSLQGGTLLATPLKGLDNQVYAMAQGAISIGGFEVQGPGQTTGRQKNHLTVARIPSGATVEQEVPVTFAQKKTITITLGAADFTTTNRMASAINKALGGNYATAKDGATVEVAVPEKYRNKEIALLATLENLEVAPDHIAKVVLDERTGTVVMGENVRLAAMALSHGNLSLQIAPKPATTPSPPEKVMVTGANGQKLVNFAEGASLGEVVRALNAVGVAPRDLIAIFQTMKASGALQADLEII